MTDSGVRRCCGHTEARRGVAYSPDTATPRALDFTKQTTRREFVFSTNTLLNFHQNKIRNVFIARRAVKFLVRLFVCMEYHKNRPYTGCHKIAAIKHHVFGVFHAVQWYCPLSKVEINIKCTAIKRSKSDTPETLILTIFSKIVPYTNILFKGNVFSNFNLKCAVQTYFFIRDFSFL